MRCQDAHTHFFSRVFFDALAGLSPKPGGAAALLDEVSKRTGLRLPDADPAAHAQVWLAAMDKAGVERMVTFASLPVEAPAVAAGARASGGRLLPYTLVDPSQPQALAFVERAFGELGMRGLLLFPAMHHVEACDPRCDALFELAAARRAPVIVHCGVFRVALRDLLGLPRPHDLRCANPLAVIPAANRHRGVTFVLPHFGGGFLREALMAGMQCENVLVDTSSSNDWMASDPSGVSLAQVFRRALGVFGAQRILFGTDSSSFPRGYRSDLRDGQLAALSEAGASDDAVADILGGNLARLLPA